MSASSETRARGSQTSGWVENFDEQLWPVNLALVVLTGISAGVIVADADFKTPDLWRNSWVHLGVVGAIALLTALGLAYLAPRAQRRLQLAALASLALHLALSIGMQQVRLFTPIVNKPEEVEVELPSEAITVPEYHNDSTTAPQEKMFSTPVDVKLPEDVVTEIKRLTEAVQPVAQPKPVQPKEQPKAEATPVELAKIDVKTPLKPEQLNTPDRQQPQIKQPDPDMQVKPLDQQPKPTPVQPTQQQPRVAIDKAQNPLQLPTRQAVPDAAPAVSVTKANTAKALQERQPENDPQLSSTQRTVNNTPTPPPMADVLKPSASNTPNPSSLDAKVRELVRSQTNAPSATPQAPKTEPAANVSQANVPGRSESRPEVTELAKLDTARSQQMQTPEAAKINAPTAPAGPTSNPSLPTMQPVAGSTTKSDTNLSTSAAATSAPRVTTTTAPSASPGSSSVQRTETTTAAGNGTPGPSALARSDNTRTDPNMGGNPAAVPELQGPTADTGGKTGPQVAVTGAANVGRTVNRSTQDGPSGVSTAPASTGPGAPTVTAAPLGRAGSTGGAPTLSPGAISGGPQLARGNGPTATVNGTQVSDLPVSNAPTGGGAGGAGTVVGPAPSVSTQRGTGAGQPSLAGLAPSAAPGGGNSTTGADVAGKNLGTPAGVMRRDDSTGGSPAPSVAVAGPGNSLGRSNRGGGTTDVPGSNNVGVPQIGAVGPAKGTTPGLPAVAAAPQPAPLAPSVANVDKDSARTNVTVAQPDRVATTGPTPSVELGMPLARATRDSTSVNIPTPQVAIEKASTAPMIDGRIDASFFGVKAQGKKFAYVVDNSASMLAENRYRRARAELQRSLGDLDEGQQYYVTLFNQRTLPMTPGQLVPAKAATIQQTLNSVFRTQPTGTTQPWQAIVGALNQRPDAIFLLTDGIFDPSVVREIENLTPEQRVPIFTIGFAIGNLTEAQKQAIEEQLSYISKLTGGTYREVP